MNPRTFKATRMTGPAASLGCCLALCLALAGDAGGQSSRAAPWSLRTVDGVSGTPVDGVRVVFPDYSATNFSGEGGIVPGHGARGSVRVLATRLGYADVDTVLAVPLDGDVRELGLQRAAVALPSLTVAAERGMTSRELQRIMFEREVAVGAIGVTKAEVEAVPPMGEADVFRSLQSFAGVSSVNDLTGQLFVRGGGSDQVAVYMDGAPVFGPFHMLGLFGAFNPDVVESTEFYRGAIPARHGGALSGVLSSTQRAGGASKTSVRGGLSLLGLRATADGSLSSGDIRWIAGARRASVDVAPLGMPYSFQDVNLGLQAHAWENHRVRGSFFASTDRFEWDSWGPEAYGSAGSDWSNLAASVSWSWVRGNRVNSEATAYYSRYRGTRFEGGVDASVAAPATTSGVQVAGVRAGVTLRGDRSGIRAGVAVEGGPVEVRGAAGGGYVSGDVVGSYLHGSVFAEAERWIGPVRLAPGVRAGMERRSSRTFVEPRFSVRWQAGSFAVSASLDRSYQFMSVLRDAYSLVPGARIWFLHQAEQPESAADGASLALDTWKGEDWTATVTGWARRFHDVPHWRPARVRDFSEMQFHDGSARGVDVTVQKHAGQVRGWLSYQWAEVRFTDDAGTTYFPQWDRRHEGEGVLTADVSDRLTLSLRGTVGSGAPFWFPAGHIAALRYDPSQPSGLGPVGYLAQSDHVTLWSDMQGRVPLYSRYDVSARYAIRWGSWELVPFASVVNATSRENILYYIDVGYIDRRDGGFEPHISYQTHMPLVPFIGIDFSF